MNLNDLTILTVTFNNNFLTIMMLKSFMKQTHAIPRIVIVDNGTYIPADDIMKRVFTVVDNYNHRLLPDELQCSRNHCAAIDYALKHAIQTKWALLVDNDILFYPKISHFLQSFDDTKYDCAGEIGWDDTPPNRLFPYFCLINCNRFKQENLSYFDRTRITDYYTIGKKETETVEHNKMDTGFSFYEDIKNTWRIHNFPLSSVCIHLKSGMLAGKNITDWISSHSDLL